MPKYDVVLTIAHSPAAKGARSADGKIVEHDYSTLICSAAVSYLNARGTPAVVAPPGSIPSKIAFVNKAAPKCCVEPHLNASPNIKVGGHMVLHYAKSVRSPGLAKAVADCLGVGLKQFKNWGPQPAPGPMVRLAKLPYLVDTKCPAIITESLFVSNHIDVAYLESTGAADTIGMLIADGVISWLRSGK
jgi:N-acetylmuramoyl-L-alanine amidase